MFVEQVIYPIKGFPMYANLHVFFLFFIFFTKYYGTSINTPRWSPVTDLS